MEPTYDYWMEGVANPSRLGRRDLPLTTEPQLGFFRTRDLKPIAIWFDEVEGVVMQVGSPPQDVLPRDHEAVWLACCRRPVAEETYRMVLDGGVWPDLDADLAKIGHNRIRSDDAEGLIDDLSFAAERYGAITDDDMAARAQSLRAALMEQHGKVDKQREAEKAPHLALARDVDSLWMPMVKKAKNAALRLRVLIESYETAKLRKQREAEREAERQREEEKKHEFMEGAVVDAPPAPEFHDASTIPAPMSSTIKGGYGRAASVKAKRVATGITNFVELATHFENNERLRGLLIQLAQWELDKLLDVPGVLVEEVAGVR